MDKDPFSWNLRISIPLKFSRTSMPIWLHTIQKVWSLANRQHPILAATVQQQASIQPQSNNIPNNITNNNGVQVGQLPQQPPATGSSSSQNGIHSGQPQQVLPSAVTSTQQQQQPLQVCQLVDFPDLSPLILLTTS